MQILPAVLAAAAFACAQTASATDIVAPSNLPLTQTVVTLGPGIDATVGSSPGRRYLCLMNIGTGTVTLGFDHPAVSGAGWALAAADQTGGQGGSMCWESGVVAGSVVHAISAAGSSIAVLEAR